MSHGRTSRRTALVFVVVLVSFSFALAQSGSVSGTWKLVEQRYERGGFNFVKADEPTVLELAPAGEPVQGRLFWHERQEAAWPAYPTPHGPAALHDVRVRRSLDGRGVTASYRVEPATGDDTWLVVTETYRLSEDGRLVGTMEIRFERDGVLKGGFTWQRTFEREAGR